MKPSVNKVSIRDFLSYILLNSKTDHPRINKEKKKQSKNLYSGRMLFDASKGRIIHGTWELYPTYMVEIIAYMGTIK